MLQLGIRGLGIARFKFNPISWFLKGEQGAWYDPSDLTTLFQDSAGTTPVTAVEQPVGLMKDKSGRGNHAFQGDMTTGAAAKRPMLSARVNLLLATATLSTQSVTTGATNYVLAFTGTGTVTLSGTATGVVSAGTNTFTAAAGTLMLTVSGLVTLADLRPTNAGALLPPYQQVNTASDYDTVGFPLYLKANGTSSTMSTNSIDFTVTDKMTVVTGVRKLSDAATGFLMEYSSSVNLNLGSFNLATPNTSLGAHIVSILKGSAQAVATGLALSPISVVLSVIHNIDEVTPSLETLLKVNSIVNGSAPSGSAGSGNFGNYPFYLFARAGTSSFFNGQFYGAIIRGAQSDTASVTQTEQYMAQKTGITF